MSDDIAIRKTRYRQMPTQDLLDLHAAGILSSNAYDVLESELGERGVTIPPRPDGGKPTTEVDKRKSSPFQHKFFSLSIKDTRNRLDKLSETNRRKMLLNLFVCYPLGFVVSLSVGIAVLKFVLNEIPPVGLIIIFCLFAIFTAIKQLNQIYNNLLNKNVRKKDSQEYTKPFLRKRN